MNQIHDFTPAVREPPGIQNGEVIGRRLEHSRSWAFELGHVPQELVLEGDGPMECLYALPEYVGVSIGNHRQVVRYAACTE